mgnify:CR=1 FL=1
MFTTELQFDAWATIPASDEDTFICSPFRIGIAGVWVSGFVALTILLIRRISGLRKQLNRDTRSANDLWQTDGDRLWQPSTPRPRLLFAHNHDLPAGVFGWLHPVVIIPPYLQANFNASEREAFLRYEFQHLYKRDPLWLLLQINLRNLLWMHPL